MHRTVYTGTILHRGTYSITSYHLREVVCGDILTLTPEQKLSLILQIGGFLHTPTQDESWNDFAYPRAKPFLGDIPRPMQYDPVYTGTYLHTYCTQGFSCIPIIMLIKSHLEDRKASRHIMCMQNFPTIAQVLYGQKLSRDPIFTVDLQTAKAINKNPKRTFLILEHPSVKFYIAKSLQIALANFQLYGI